jgi:hypothetical protein
LYKFYVCDRKFLRASVVARHSSSELGSALTPRNLVNLLHRRLLCLRTTIQYQVKSTFFSLCIMNYSLCIEKTVRFFYPMSRQKQLCIMHY